MQVNIELPEDVSRALRERWGDVSRRTLEAIALEGYRSRALSESQVRRLLGFETRMDVHAFLKQAGIPLRLCLKSRFCTRFIAVVMLSYGQFYAQI